MYVDFANVYFSDLASKFPKHTGINNYAIKLVDGQLSTYKPIYSLGLVELEILKFYIEINLANKLIRLFKPPPVLPFCLTRSQIVFLDYASTIEVSITL